MIDTSSVIAGVAAVVGDRTVAEVTHPSGRSLDLPALVRRVADPAAVARIAVATGPGSFTGLRVGAAFGLGLAFGRRLPLLTFSSLRLQSERARVPATAVIEAGRGRVYYLTPEGKEGMSDAAGLPAGAPAVGWLRDSTAARLPVPLLGDADLRSFGEAACRILGRASETAYGRVRLRYMHSFEALA